MEGSNLLAHRGLKKNDYFEIKKWWYEVVR